MSGYLLCASVTLGVIAATGAALADETPTSEIVVTAPRAEVKARDEQKNAPNLVNVQAAETIAKYPDFNAAEALARIPGITLSSDTGEGRFVNIRGIDGNLNGATYGGVVLLNTNPSGTVFGTGRAVEFDTIPTGAIDGIIVTKTGLPNHEAEGLGGSIELTPRSAAKVDHLFVDGAIGYGYEPAHDHGGPLNLDLSIGSRFGGANKPFSFVLTGSWREDRRGFDDIEEDYIDAPLSSTSGPAFSALQQNKALADIQLRHYDYHRRRFGYGGELEYNPDTDQQYYIRASVAGYTESVVKNRLTYDDLFGGVNDTVNPANPAGYLTTTDITIKGTNEQETHLNQVYVIGGRDTFDAFTLDYRASYSAASFNVDYNYGSTFKGPEGVPFQIDNITNANVPSLGVTDGTNVNDPSLYKLSKLSNSTEAARDHEWAFAVNGKLATKWIGDDDTLQFGAEVRLRDKTDTPFNEDVSFTKIGLAAVSTAPDTDFYGHFTNGPMIDEGQLLSATGASVGPAVADDTQFFHVKEDVYAGYGMYNFSVGKLGVLAGARVEHTEATYSNFGFDADGNNTGAQSQKRNYTNVFPTVQLRYPFTPELVARATYSTGIARPGFSQVAQPISIDTDNGIVTIGNPSLKPTYGNNFDLSLERYLPHGGILSLGAFDKEFNNYITPLGVTGTSPYIPGNGILTVTFTNAHHAWARGVEAAYEQHFTFLPPERVNEDETAGSRD
jgi:TonB-dependent receptor